jgi:hypothetical protein
MVDKVLLCRTFFILNIYGCGGAVQQWRLAKIHQVVCAIQAGFNVTGKMLHRIPLNKGRARRGTGVAQN